MTPKLMKGLIGVFCLPLALSLTSPAQNKDTAEVVDFVFLFMSPDGLDSLTKSKFELGARVGPGSEGEMT